MAPAIHGPGPLLGIEHDNRHRPRLLGKALSASELSAMKMRRRPEWPESECCNTSANNADARYGTMLGPRHFQAPVAFKRTAGTSGTSVESHLARLVKSHGDGARISELLGRSCSSLLADKSRSVSRKTPPQRAASAGKIRPVAMRYRVASSSFGKSLSIADRGLVSHAHRESKDYSLSCASAHRTHDTVMLTAGDLFDQVIEQDRTYGPLLQEIKQAYETYLTERKVSLPSALGPNPARKYLTEEIMIPDVHKEAFLEQDSSSAILESAVDAARRPWLEASDDTCRGEFVKARELERENYALRALIKHLENGCGLHTAGRLNGSSVAGSCSKLRQSSANGLQQLPAPNLEHVIMASDNTAVPRSIPVPLAAMQRQQKEIVASARSDTSLASTLPWVAEEPLHRHQQPAARPNCVPELDFGYLLELLQGDEIDGYDGEDLYYESPDDGLQQ